MPTLHTRSVSVVSLLALVLVCGYAVFTFRTILQDPTITLSIPSPTSTSSPTIFISGTTTRSTKLLLDNRRLSLTESGVFGYERALKEGYNRFEIMAVSRASTTVQKVLEVVYLPIQAK
jgi:hypothetical protein